MTNYSIQNQLPVFLSATGAALNAGKVYIGLPNQDPQTFPKAVYWDQAGTDPVDQTNGIDVIGGYITRAGSPATIYISGSYSVRVRDRFDVQVYYIPEVNDDIVDLTAQLLTTAGAGMIGYSRSAAYPAATVGKKLQQNINPLDAPYSATGDGVTDDRAALYAADQVGPVVISVRHRVASNLTFANIPTFVGPGGLIIDAGVTVSFPRHLTATQDRQIFFGDGIANGLDRVNVVWFAGDSGVGVSAIASIQKALGAANPGAEVIWDRAYYSDGSAYLDVQNAQNIISPGRTLGKLLWTTAACLGFRISGTEGASIRGIGFAPSDINTIPTSGEAVLVTAPNCVVENCYSTHCYRGVRWSGINGGKDLANNFNGATHSANWVDNSPNIEIANCSGSAFSDWVDVSTTAGFIAGESITFASGGNGSWGYTTSGTRAKIIINDKSPSIGTTITGATSGATCTLTTLTKGHQFGGLRVTDNAAAFNVVASAWAGGVYPGAGDATVDAHGSRPEYSAITNCYFDHGDNGFLLTRGAGIKFLGTWFSARFGTGLQINEATHVSVSACTMSGSWDNGVLIGAAAKGIIVTESQIEGNNRSNNGKAGVYVIAGTTDFIVKDNRIGGQTAPGFGGTQARPVIVEGGASDRYVIKNNLVQGNTNNAIQDGGTGVNKSVAENY